MEAQKRFAAVDRADFIVFAAGLVLRELIKQAPAREISGLTQLTETDQNAGTLEIIRFWPEGFLYTNYCVSVISAVHEQEFGSAPSIDKCADDLRTWWSYRENVTEMPAYAVAFLDRFLGAEPNWITPDRAQSRQAMVHHRDAVGQRHCLGLIVGDVDDGGAGALVEGSEFILHRGPEMHVQIGKRLVEQHQRGCGDQAPRQCHTLALAAGKIGGPALAQPLQIDQGQRVFDLLACDSLVELCHLQRIADIFRNRHGFLDRLGVAQFTHHRIHHACSVYT